VNGKGDKRRPEDKAKIDANWDRIFSKNANALNTMWNHECEEQGGALVGIASGEYCSFCARGEEHED
jgi:hypothetical protein